jgi:signal-transduction protein with cAMP-binding, CBS, and nucleotidyltransferase domain
VKDLPEEFLKTPVIDVMDKKVIILDESVSINECAKIMENQGISSVLVRDSSSGSIKGIVTERDILYRAVAQNLGLFKVSIDKIMSSPLLTVDKEKPSIEAIRIMRTNSIRRLPVVDNGKVVGMVTLMSLVGNVPIRNVELAQLEVPESTSFVTCPYDGSKFKDKNELSKHIDRVHLGSGLLEGDLRQF